MKKSIFKTASLVCLLVFIVASCGKYEDGPNFALTTKKARISRDWILSETMTANGQTETYNGTDFWSLSKDGKATYTVGGVSLSGSWDFVDSKERLKISVTIPFVNTTQELVGKIKRLTSSELWIYDEATQFTRKYKAK